MSETDKVREKVEQETGIDSRQWIIEDLGGVDEYHRDVEDVSMTLSIAFDGMPSRNLMLEKVQEHAEAKTLDWEENFKIKIRFVDLVDGAKLFVADRGVEIEEFAKRASYCYPDDVTVDDLEEVIECSLQNLMTHKI